MTTTMSELKERIAERPYRGSFDRNFFDTSSGQQFVGGGSSLRHFSRNQTYLILSNPG